MKRYQVVWAAGALVLVAGLGAGCGGISGSHSVSPASFFLPGLIQHEVPAPDPTGEKPAPVSGPAVKPLAG